MGCSCEGIGARATYRASFLPDTCQVTFPQWPCEVPCGAFSPNSVVPWDMEGQARLQATTRTMRSPAALTAIMSRKVPEGGAMKGTLVSGSHEGPAIQCQYKRYKSVLYNN